jgi:glycosyltransferase involved in cell wall biosynthesis
MLAIFATHPIQYYVPIYRTLEAQFGIPVTAIYGTDCSVAGYRDREFGTSFAWDTDLLSGYRAVFLSRVRDGGGDGPERAATRGMGRALAAAAPGAVLLTGYSPRFHQAAFYHTWRAGLPILLRADTTDHAVARSRAKTWVRDLALRALYRRCASLLYVGRRFRDHLRRLAPAEASLVFSPHCVDARSFTSDEGARGRLRAAARESLRIAAADIAILFSGKLVPRKGPELLARAAAGLPAKVRDRLALIYLGDGDLRSSLDAMTKGLGLRRVCFPGFRNQTELSRYYHAADVMVLPSLHSETWGLVVNEALHHGLPCVVSEAVGCAPDLVEPRVTGEVCDTGSIPSLASALMRALPLLGRDDTRQACRARVAGYSVERAAAGIAEAYESVVRVGQRAGVAR